MGSGEHEKVDVNAVDEVSIIRVLGWEGGVERWSKDERNDGAMEERGIYPVFI